MWRPTLGLVVDNAAVHIPIHTCSLPGSRSSPQRLFLQSTACPSTSHRIIRALRPFHCTSRARDSPAPLPQIWTQEELDKLRSLLGEGRTYRQVAQAMGRTTYHLAQVCRYDAAQSGYYTPERPEDVQKFRTHLKSEIESEPPPSSKKAPSKTQTWTQEEYDYLNELRASGCSLQEISKKLGRSVSGVRSYMLRTGIRLPGDRLQERVLLWTQADTDRLRELQASGLTFEEIAKKLYRSQTSVIIALQRLGIYRAPSTYTKLPRRKWLQAEQDRMLELHASGMQIAQIAKELKRSYETVKSAMQRHTQGAQKKRRAYGYYSASDDQLIMDLLKEGKTMKEIHARMPERPLSSIARRASKMGFREAPVERAWTDEDVDMLFDLRAKGRKWTEVAAAFPQRRSVTACQTKFYSLNRFGIHSEAGGS